MLTAEQRALATTRSGSRAQGRGHVNSYWATRSRDGEAPWQKHRFHRAWCKHMVVSLIVEQNFAPAALVLEFWAASMHRLTPRIRWKQEIFLFSLSSTPNPHFLLWSLMTMWHASTMRLNRKGLFFLFGRTELFLLEMLPWRLLGTWAPPCWKPACEWAYVEPRGRKGWEATCHRLGPRLRA